MVIIIRLTLAVIAAGVSVALSWPFWRDFEYWAESETAWALHFGLGFLLAVGVFYLFFESLTTLFEHDEIERRRRAGVQGGARAGAEEAGA